MRYCLFVCWLCLSFSAQAKHGKGSVLGYTYLGKGASANTSKYQIYLRMYCTVGDQKTNQSTDDAVRIYDAATNALVSTLALPLISRTNLTNTNTNPCISPVVTISYVIKDYAATIELPDNTAGYVLAQKEYARASGIVNFVNSVSYGVINTNTIPGVLGGTVYRNNSSPVFAVRDTTVICFKTNFVYDVSATDPDGDSLSYAFCAAKGDLESANSNSTNWAPPYDDMPYASGFSGTQPMGSNVTIDPITGLVSGVAPNTTGAYVLGVCVSEYRNGVLINTTKKEIQITVANCSLTAAALKVAYVNCDDYQFTFQNESTASNITSYAWDFGVPTITTDVSSAASPTYVYPAAGSYTLKLVVTNSGGCKDSTTAPVKVYPGFTPGFTVEGSCFQSPFAFTNTTIFNPLDGPLTWSWDFGDVLVNNTDTASTKNAVYTYSKAATYQPKLTATSIRGCVKTFTTPLIANDKPYLQLPFTDTLICSIDSLPLKANIKTGTFTWSPVNQYMLNANTLSPIVFPKDTTVYTITVQDKGCIDSATIKVNVLDFISVKFRGDTVLCATDSITLRPISDALSYLWTETPAGQNSLSSFATKYPKAAPLVTTTYRVTANLGYCQDKTSVTVRVSPYPKVYAGADTTICYGGKANLRASITASNFVWKPIATLSNFYTLRPIAQPDSTTAYYLTVKDTFYCPKSVTDTVVVKVIPPIVVNAGADVAAVQNQAIALNAYSNLDSLVHFKWLPARFLSADTIANPVFKATNTLFDSVVYTVAAYTSGGCIGADKITVKIYKTGPDIFVPSGFTPNNDARNDVLKAIPVGIQQFQYLKVFNRYGQLVFSTSDASRGWNGYVNGVKQDAGTFVYMARGIDYLGNAIERKGTTVLLR